MVDMPVEDDDVDPETVTSMECGSVSDHDDEMKNSGSTTLPHSMALTVSTLTSSSSTGISTTEGVLQFHHCSVK
jgi:hypothetical protein